MGGDDREECSRSSFQKRMVIASPLGRHERKRGMARFRKTIRLVSTHEKEIARELLMKGNIGKKRGDWLGEMEFGKERGRREPSLQ